MTSFKNYNIIDYDHKYTMDGKWYQQKLGKPLESWQNKGEVKYIDIFDVERTVPPGTWWLKSMITNPETIQEIDNKTLNSYSLTTANKEFADRFMQHQSSSLSTKSAELEDLLEDHNLALKHRTLIRDIKNPVAFTVSLTGFPCVGGAVFAKKCLEDSKNNSQTFKNKGDNMTDGINLSFDNLKELLSMKTKKDTDDVYVTEEKLDEKFEENNKKLAESFAAIIDEKIGKKDEPKDKDDEPKDKDDTSNQTSKKSQSKQIDHKDDGDDQISHKSGTPEHKLLQQLGRDANGNSILKL